MAIFKCVIISLTMCLWLWSNTEARVTVVLGASARPRPGQNGAQTKQKNVIPDLKKAPLDANKVQKHSDDFTKTMTPGKYVVSSINLYLVVVIVIPQTIWY